MYLGYTPEFGEMKVIKILNYFNGESVKQIQDFSRLIDIHRRTIVTKVEVKIGRLIVLQNIGHICELDRIKSSFTPEAGDIVKLEAIYQTCIDKDTIAGEV